MSLYDLTKDAQDKLESHPFIKLLESGTIDPKVYLIYLYNQYQMYDLLESHALAHGLLRDLPGLQRAGRIYDDFYELWDKKSEIPKDLPITTAYKEYLCKIYANPENILAHIYARHLRDLSLKEEITTNVPGHGSFYKFNDPEKLKESLQLKLKNSMANEVNKCFEFIITLLDNLLEGSK